MRFTAKRNKQRYTTHALFRTQFMLQDTNKPPTTNHGATTAARPHACPRAPVTTPGPSTAAHSTKSICRMPQRQQQFGPVPTQPARKCASPDASPGPFLVVVGGCAVRCARAVRNTHLGPISPDGRGDHSTFCVPMCRTAQILTQSQHSGNELNRPTFPTNNAGLLSVSACFPPGDVALPVVGGLQSGHGKADLLSGALQNRPLMVPPHLDGVCGDIVAVPCGYAAFWQGASPLTPSPSAQATPCPPLPSPPQQLTPPPSRDRGVVGGGGGLFHSPVCPDTVSARTQGWTSSPAPS